MAKCILCDNPCEESSVGALDLLYRVQCRHCATYEITDAARQAQPAQFVKENLHYLSAVTRHSSERKSIFRIEAKLLQDRSEFEANVLSQCPQRVEEKLDRILLHLGERSAYPGSEVKVDVENDYPLFFCHGLQELTFHLHHLRDSDMIGLREVLSPETPWVVALSTLGWQRVEALQIPNVDSTQAFVAMWFDEQLDSAYKEGIAPLDNDTGFRMLRIDIKQFNEKICDHIIAEIRRSRFLIADVTGHRQGVYFEAGFAMGLGLPVIWTCRKDQVTGCHFDTRQYNHIVWETPAELREKLRDRILATIGRPGGGIS